MKGRRDATEGSLIRALRGEDDLGVVIRAHLHIEHHLNELIELVMPGPKFFEEMGLSYANQVRLAAASGAIRPELARPLRALGKLRNDMAHKLGTRLTRARERRLFNALSEADKQLMEVAFQRTKAQVDSPNARRLSDLKTPDLFILLVVTLRAALLTAKSDLLRLRSEAQRG